MFICLVKRDKVFIVFIVLMVRTSTLFLYQALSKLNYRPKQRAQENANSVLSRWVSPRYYAVDPMLLPLGNPITFHQSQLDALTIFPQDREDAQRSFRCVQMFMQNIVILEGCSSRVLGGLLRKNAVLGGDIRLKSGEHQLLFVLL